MALAAFNHPGFSRCLRNRHLLYSPRISTSLAASYLRIQRFLTFENNTESYSESGIEIDHQLSFRFEAEAMAAKSMRQIAICPLQLIQTIRLHLFQLILHDSGILSSGSGVGYDKGQPVQPGPGAHTRDPSTYYHARIAALTVRQTYPAFPFFTSICAFRLTSTSFSATDSGVLPRCSAHLHQK